MAPGISSCHYREVPPSISFSGSGFMVTYQLGVAQCILNYAPWIIHTAPCVLGASAGSLVAAAVACEMNMITIRDEVLTFAKQLMTFTLGPLNPSVNVFHWLEFILRKYLPSDAHRRAGGRLAVAVTHMIDGKSMTMSDFQSKEDLVQALLCSCFVPGYCGVMPPSFKGEYYMDGGFTSMQPILPVPCSQMLTVSPFSGDVDICPTDTPSMWDMVVSGATLKGNFANSVRILNALYPMALETLGQAYDSGFKDGIHFLLNNDLVPYFMIQEVSQGPQSYNQTKMQAHSETNTKEEKDMKDMTEVKENPTLTSFTYDKEPKKEPSLHFDIVKNALLANVMTYSTMFGFPAKIFYHIILPFMLLLDVILQSGHRLELMFKEAPDLMFWAWYGSKQMTFFFSDILIASLKKNLKDRFMPIKLLLKWIMRHYEATQGQRHIAPCHKPRSFAHSEGHRNHHRMTGFQSK